MKSFLMKKQLSAYVAVDDVEVVTYEFEGGVGTKKVHLEGAEDICLLLISKS
jgi:hypothetical protein